MRVQLASATTTAYGLLRLAVVTQLRLEPGLGLGAYPDGMFNLYQAVP